jgi:hypothetical protein
MSNKSPICVSAFKNYFKNIVNADSTNEVTIFEAEADCIIRGINVASDDPAERYMKLLISSGGTSYLQGEVTIPITAGAHATNATGSVNALDETKIKGNIKDLETNRLIRLVAGEILKGKMIAAVTNTNTVTITATVDFV